MLKATIVFQKLAKDIQSTGFSCHYMLSRVFYDLNFDGRVFKNLHVNIKQALNSTADTGNLELIAPYGYEALLVYQAFREEVEKYYLDSIGTEALSLDSQGHRLSHINIYSHRTCQIEIGDEDRIEIMV
jgi:hypothetical protein